MTKIVFITGASSGIGKAAAEHAIQAGHKVFATARNPIALAELAKTYPSAFRYAIADVTDQSVMEAAFAACLKEYGRIDVLVNNAGLGIFDPLAEGKLDDWHTMFDVNVKGLLTCVHLALPELRKQRGQLINITSVAAHNVFPNSGVYCSTKHAVLAISEAIRLELGTEIRVTSISPGSVNTAFIDQTRNPQLLANYKDYFAAGLSPDDIARQILYAIDAPENQVISEIIIRPNKAVK
jgi:NADP-dependent 3-hydroxy acid dehydrogenase YdfG